MLRSIFDNTAIPNILDKVLKSVINSKRLSLIVPGIYQGINFTMQKLYGASVTTTQIITNMIT